jgi:hypothetical protein
MRLIREEMMKMKQRMNELELRQDHNEIKVDSIETIVRANPQLVKSNKSSPSSIAEAAQSLETDKKQYPLFDAELFTSYLTDKSGLWTNLITKSDNPKHQWAQQLRFEDLFFIIILNKCFLNMYFIRYFFNPAECKMRQNYIDPLSEQEVVSFLSEIRVTANKTLGTNSSKDRQKFLAFLTAIWEGFIISLPFIFCVVFSSINFRFARLYW